MPNADVYRMIYLTAHGYVVYRHCFDEKMKFVELGALEHKQAVFVSGVAAHDYCNYRNLLIDLNGDDGLPPARRF